MRLYLGFALILIAVLTLLVWAISVYIQPILPSTVNSSMMILAAALAGVTGVLAGLKDTLELLKSLAERDTQRDIDQQIILQPKPKCPYPGMIPFSADNARFFYGREDEIKRMVRHFRNQSTLFIIGPSGCGKTSLIYAGFLPNLSDSSLFLKDFWLVRSMRPHDNPNESLSFALGSNLADIPRTVDHLITMNSPKQCLLLVVDQFEESFTLSETEEQDKFFDKLRELQRLDNCFLLVSMRADFYPDLMNSKLWPLSTAQRMEIIPIRGSALRQAVQKPAEDSGVYLEPPLVERLLSDAANEPGSLPLLQETMVLLWEDMEDRRISLHAYERLGGEGRSGMVEAMSIRADATLAQLSLKQQNVAKHIFLRLVQLGEGRADTRRRRRLEEIRPAGESKAIFDRTLRLLTDNRLLTLSGNENTATWVDISHEALITGWSTLREWIDTNREGLRIHRHLTQAAIEWDRLGRDPGELYRGARLTQMMDWFKEHARELNSLELEFIHACENQLHKELAARHLEAIQKWQQRGLEDDLHELINWYHAGVVLSLEAIDEWMTLNDYEKAKALLPEIVNRARATIDELRTIHMSIYSRISEARTLSEALHTLVSAWSTRATRTNGDELKIIIECPEDFDLPAPIRAPFLRIATNALTNAILHSGITEDPNITILIDVEQVQDGVILQVFDSGKGIEFSVENYGISRMRQLVTQLNSSGIDSSIEFKSTKGEGTLVTLRIHLEG